MMISNRVGFHLSEFHSALIENFNGPLRVISITHHLTIETSLAKVMAKSHKDKALTRHAGNVVLEHIVKNLK